MRFPVQRKPHDESKWTAEQARARLQQVEHLLAELHPFYDLDERMVLLRIRANLTQRKAA